MTDHEATELPEGRTRRGGRAALRKQRSKRRDKMLPALKNECLFTDWSASVAAHRIVDA